MDKRNNIINYYEFLKEISILQCKNAKNSADGIKSLIENNTDAITYNHTDKLLLFNVSVLHIDNEGNYFYDYFLEKNCDVISGITFASSRKLTVKLTYYIGGIEYKYGEIDELLIVCGMYNEFKIRITFLEKPLIDDEFSFSSKMIVLKPKCVDRLRYNTVVTKNNIYHNGICFKKLPSKL